MTCPFRLAVEHQARLRAALPVSLGPVQLAIHAGPDGWYLAASAPGAAHVDLVAVLDRLITVRWVAIGLGYDPALVVGYKLLIALPIG